MLRETKGKTQQQLADAAGVSLSTIRRLEREAEAQFHATTEKGIEYLLGLRPGGLAHLRLGGAIDDAFESKSVIRFPRSLAYREAPLSELAAAESYVARVMARSLEKLLGHRVEELTLLAAGKLTIAIRNQEPSFMFQWLPWPAQVHATPIWLDRFMDSADQLRSVLEDGEVPHPLRMAEAVALHLAHDYAWNMDTGAFFDPETREEIDDPFYEIIDLYQYANPRQLFDRSSQESEWVSEESRLHPARWWERPDTASTA
jgi:transcriptional regulator with XRE-family HTH domain